MTTEKLWEQYQHYTRDLTEHSRKLAFAVAAICWFFRTPETTFPPAVLWSLALLICFFVFDVLHYLTGAFTVRLFLEHHEKAHYEKTGAELQEISKPRWVDRPATFFFIAKTLVLLSSFAALGTEFYYRIFLDR